MPCINLEIKFTIKNKLHINEKQPAAKPKEAKKFLFFLIIQIIDKIKVIKPNSKKNQ